MTTPAYKQIRVDETNTNVKINQNLDSIKTVLDTFTNQPQITTLSQISLQTGLNTIPHGLNKPLTDCIPGLPNAQVTLWSSQNDASIATLPSIYLYINSSGTCVVNLYVY